MCLVIIWKNWVSSELNDKYIVTSQYWRNKMWNGPLWLNSSGKSLVLLKQMSRVWIFMNREKTHTERVLPLCRPTWLELVPVKHIQKCEMPQFRKKIMEPDYFYCIISLAFIFWFGGRTCKSLSFLGNAIILDRSQERWHNHLNNGDRRDFLSSCQREKKARAKMWGHIRR